MSHPSSAAAGTAALVPAPQGYGAYPYLLTVIARRLHVVQPLPEQLSEDELGALCRSQVYFNRLPAYLALGADRWHRVLPEAPPERCDRPNLSGGLLLPRHLRFVRTLDTPDVRRREQELDALRETQPTGYVTGDLTKGAREPGDLELTRLAGSGPDGIRRGMSRCPDCSGLRGECLDPRPYTGVFCVVRVHCRCENHNRCAACGERLHEWRLDANYYDEAADIVWHVPGFCGLSHAKRCAGRPRPRPGVGGRRYA